MALSSNWRSNIFWFLDVSNPLYYLSQKDGNDISTGLLAAAPKKTLESIILNGVQNKRIQVRSSYFNEGEIDILSSSLTRHEIYGDGNVVIDGVNFDYIFKGENVNFRVLFNNITLINIEYITDIVGVFSFINCVIKDSVINSKTSTIRITRISKSIFISASLYIEYKYLPFGSITISLFKNNTFIDTSIYFLNGLSIDSDRNYFNKATTIVDDSSTMTAYTFTSCAFQFDTTGTTIFGTAIDSITLSGDTDVITTEYADGALFTGTATIGSITVTFTNCMWVADPLFVDAPNELYYLQAKPIQSKLFNKARPIGRHGLGQVIKADHPHFDTNNGAVYANVINDVVNNRFELDTSMAATTGFIRGSTNKAYAIDLGAVISITQPMLFSMLGFNFFNGEWVDENNYTISNQEVRLTVIIQAWNDAINDWGDATEFEINSGLYVDSAGKGNGDVDIDFTNEAPIAARYIRFSDIVIRNDGV